MQHEHIAGHPLRGNQVSRSGISFEATKQNQKKIAEPSHTKHTQPHARAGVKVGRNAQVLRTGTSDKLISK